jgi:hypothetical protein
MSAAIMPPAEQGVSFSDMAAEQATCDKVHKLRDNTSLHEVEIPVPNSSLVQGRLHRSVLTPCASQHAPPCLHLSARHWPLWPACLMAAGLFTVYMAGFSPLHWPLG